jgi:excisionase family DNA binding protein
MNTIDQAILETLLPLIEQKVEALINERMKNVKQEPPFTFHDELPITTELLAERMGLSKSFLYQQVSKNKIPHHKRCKRLYFIPSEIKEWVKGNWKKN